MISKYKKSWYCKILTILLALVIVVAVPFSSLQAYAREEGQPTETFYEEDILLDTNTKTDKLIDNNQDSVDQISSIEAEPEVITLGSSEPTTWGVFDSDGLENALNNFSSGDTIKLKSDIEYNNGIVIDGKTVEFNVGSFTLNIISSTGSKYGVGLEVKNGGHVRLVGSGEFNVTQISTNSGSVGVLARESSSAMVTNVRSVSGDGLYANGNGAVIQVLGDVYATGSGAYGARTWGGGQINIDGTLTATYYIIVGTESKGKSEGEEDPIKPGYLKYSDEENNGIVWVKETVEGVCEIDGTQYGTISQALAAIGGGEAKTIKLLKSVEQGLGIDIEDGREITFDLNNYTLNIYNPAGAGLRITEGRVDYIGEGEFNVRGKNFGVMVNGADAHATVTNATATGPQSRGVEARSGGKVTVKGDVSAIATPSWGVHADNGGKITVDGTVSGTQCGVVVSLEGSKVNAMNAYAVDGAAVSASGGEVVISGDAIGGTNGVIADAGSIITIGGNVAASQPHTYLSSGYAIAISSPEGTEITVGGTISAATPDCYILFGSLIPKTEEQRTLPTTKEGYHTYTDDGKNFVWVKDAESSTHFINIQNDGKGTASANVYFASEGEKITLTATPNEGYIFKEWQVVSGDVSIEGNKFTMPGENVTIKAIFEAVSVESYTVTVEGSYAGITGAGNYDAGDTVNIYAGSRSGYTFNGWTSKDGVVFADASNATTTFVMPEKNVTVTANWTYKGSRGRSRGSSSEKTDNTTTSPEAKKFIDIEKHWAEESIDYVADLGLFYGTSDTTFSPDASMSRGMMVTVLGRLAEADVKGYVSSFDDVIDSIYYAKYTEWARVKGIALGVGGNKFAPDASITRQDLVVMLVRYASVMGLKVPDLNVDVAFSDVESIASYAKEATEAMQKAGIINGRPDGIFDPDASVTRAEVSAILHRFLLLFSDSGDLV